jgi:hypothetical protein
MTPDRHNAIHNLNYYVLPDPPLFSLPSTFKANWRWAHRVLTTLPPSSRHREGRYRNNLNKKNTPPPHWDRQAIYTNNINDIYVKKSPCADMDSLLSEMLSC